MNQQAYDLGVLAQHREALLLAFSHFYPASGKRVDLWSWGKDAEAFAWRYLGASTALDVGGTAEEGSLHAVEFITPAMRDGDLVCPIGYVIERAQCMHRPAPAA